MEKATGPRAFDILAGQKHVLELIATGAPLSKTLDAIVRLVESQYPQMLSSILLLDPDGVHVRHGAAPNLPEAFVHAIDGEPIGPAAGSCGTAAWRGEPVIVEDIATDPLWDRYRSVALSHGLRACWSTPICDPSGRVLGTFAMYFREPRQPDPDHREMIDVATHMAAIAIFRDRRDAALRASEARLNAAQRIARIGSYVWEPRANVVHGSEELFRLFGLEPGTFPVQLDDYLEYVHPEDRARSRASIEAMISTAAPFERDERIVRPDGSVRLIRSRGSWQFDDRGEPVRVIGTCQDITDQQRSEDELRRREREIGERQRVAELLAVRNEELKTFAYTVSHDLKAPLRAIGGYARELDVRHREAIDERTRLCITRIQQAAQDLERLIEELLQYSRLDTLTLTSTSVDLAAAVQAVVNSRAQQVASLGASVTVEVSGTVRTWPLGLHHVLTNLVDNALKYSSVALPPTVRITSDVHGNGVRLAIADNGIGFDMKHHDRLFRLFVRLVPQEEFEGTGAGLAIAKKLVERMGGALHADSRPGAGATFFVDLPFSPPQAGVEPER